MLKRPPHRQDAPMRIGRHRRSSSAPSCDGSGTRGRTLPDVLSRLDAYLETLRTDRSPRSSPRSGTRRHWSRRGRTSRGPQTRTLVSDYALARAPGGHAWTGFRDTYEVDGAPVRDREDRLLALMADGSADSARQALRISRANARYNLGEDVVARTINVPTVALDFIHPRNRTRLTIEQARRRDRRWRPRLGRRVPGARAADAPAHARRPGPPSARRGPSGPERQAKSSGPISTWDGSPAGFVVVHYRRDDRIGALVPETMLEEYRGATRARHRQGHLHELPPLRDGSARRAVARPLSSIRLEWSASVRLKPDSTDTAAKRR